VSVALAVQCLPPALLAEVRAACRALGLPTEDWKGGIPRTPPLVVVTALDAGERRLPDDLCALMEASPGVRAVVCANEPLVKPRVSLGNGRVVLLAPPVDRVRLIAVIRNTIGADAPASPGAGTGSRFEVLRRQYWVAWARGTDARAITLDEHAGMTVAVGAPEAAATFTAAIADEASDAERGAAVARELGEQSAAVHLLEDGAEWVIYWPRRDCPLWICSHQRLPTRWDAAAACAASGRPFMRIPAFPGDQVVGGWLDKGTTEAFGPLANVMLEGGPETLAAMATITEHGRSLAGLVVELR
jgi:hypothetical protein